MVVDPRFREPEGLFVGVLRFLPLKFKQAHHLFMRQPLALHLKLDLGGRVRGSLVSSWSATNLTLAATHVFMLAERQAGGLAKSALADLERVRSSLARGLAGKILHRPLQALDVKPRRII